MLIIGLLILIVVSILSYVHNRNYDARFQYGKQIAEHIDLEEIFETSYLGGFGFDEELPNEDLRKETESQFDKGVESRLGLHFARTLPKWVLETAAKDIKRGQFNSGSSPGQYVSKQIDIFAETRRSELSGLLKTRADSAPEPVGRRRRRRR